MFSPTQMVINATILVVIIGLAVGALYFLPSIIASCGKKRNVAAIFALNFFLGWSVVGWVVALVWSLMVEEKQIEVHKFRAPHPKVRIQGGRK